MAGFLLLKPTLSFTLYGLILFVIHMQAHTHTHTHTHMHMHRLLCFVILCVLQSIANSILPGIVITTYSLLVLYMLIAPTPAEAEVS